jgi:hypothetical protein
VIASDPSASRGHFVVDNLDTHRSDSLVPGWPSPLSNGRDNSWACGIIYALGFINFLFDSSREPYISAGELCQAFGVSTSTGSARSRAVRDAVNMRRFDANWCLSSRIPENPLVWMLEVDGVIVDVRWMPGEIQGIAYHKGLIPLYLSTEKEKQPHKRSAVRCCPSGHFLAFSIDVAEQRLLTDLQFDGHQRPTLLLGPLKTPGMDFPAIGCHLTVCHRCGLDWLGRFPGINHKVA